MRLFTILALSGFAPMIFADADVSSVATGGGMSSFIMIGVMFVMMYFLMIRPQSKRAKEHRELISSVSKDDEVVTQGGMLGKIVRVTDSFFVLAIGENIEVPVQKQSVSQVLPKGTIKSI